jgi:hypothetical protein
MSVTLDNGTILMLISLGAVPLAALTFSRAGEVYRSINKGALTIGQELPLPRYLRSPAQAIDPAIQAAEVRQMLQAKSEHRQRLGQQPVDVATEAERLLWTTVPGPTREAMLHADIRELVIARNERRMRRGLEPLNIEAETERQLEDLVGSP